MKKNEERPLLTILVIMLIAFVVSVGILLLTIFLHDPKKDMMEDYEKHLAKRTELVDLVKTYQLEYDENGLITNLDKVELSGLAHNDKVYVKYNEEEKVIVEFVYRAGFPDEGQSIFYSSGGKKLLEEKIDKTLYAYIEEINDNWCIVQWN